MNKIEIVKTVVGMGVGLGVNSIVSGFITNNIPGKMDRIKRITVGLGGMALSSMVADKAIKHAEQKIDDGIKTMRNIVNKIDEEEEQ